MELEWLARGAATLNSGLEFSCAIQAKMVANILQNSTRLGLSACAEDLQAAQAVMGTSSPNLLTELSRQGLLQKSNTHLEELEWMAWSAATLSSGLEFTCATQAKTVAKTLQNSARLGQSASAKNLQATQAVTRATSFTGQLNGHLEMAVHEKGQTTRRATDASRRTYYAKMVETEGDQ